jgi:cell shape-determining protein MreD
VVFLAFYECSLLGVVTAFMLGIFIDMSAGVIVGPWAGAYVVVYAFFVFLSQRLFVDSALVSMVVVGVASLLAGAVFLLLAFEYQAVSREDGLMLLGQAGASALFAPIIFRILVRVWKRGSSASTRRGSVVSAV